jgi:glycosyltransferase involved in cell wall biosynthesis
VKIIHTVESYLPARHGMSEVVRQVSERLVARGHEVTVLTGDHHERTTAHIAGVEVKSFAVHGKSAIGVSGDVQGYQQYLLDASPDIITNFAAQQWATDLVFPLLPRMKAKKVFVPTGFSGRGDALFASYFRKMRDWMGLYDACVFLSDDYRDINFARESGIKKTVLIPNGAALDEFDRPKDPEFRKRLGIPEDHFLVIHVAGYLSVAKGQIEAIEIFGKSEIQNATLLLICNQFAEGRLEGLMPSKLARGCWQLFRGRGLSGFLPAWQIEARRRLLASRNKEHGRNIVTAVLSREETVSAFLDADLLLFPSWIECSPLVLFEAAAASTPFLVTDVGNSKEIIRWTGGGKLLPGKRMEDREGSVVADIAGSARVLEQLREDAPGRKKMAESAHAAWRSRFTWEVIADQYEELYRALLAGEDICGKFPPPPDANE